MDWHWQISLDNLSLEVNNIKQWNKNASFFAPSKHQLVWLSASGTCNSCTFRSSNSQALHNERELVLLMWTALTGCFHCPWDLEGGLKIINPYHTPVFHLIPLYLLLCVVYVLVIGTLLWTLVCFSFWLVSSLFVNPAGGSWWFT